MFLELMATFRIEDANPQEEYFVDWRNSAIDTFLAVGTLKTKCVSWKTSAMGLLLTVGTPKNKSVHY